MSQPHTGVLVWGLWKSALEATLLDVSLTQEYLYGVIKEFSFGTHSWAGEWRQQLVCQASEGTQRHTRMYCASHWGLLAP
jgi:hypothetical protein